MQIICHFASWSPRALVFVYECVCVDDGQVCHKQPENKEKN